MPVAPSETLSRYIFTTNYFRGDNSVKWQAFKPKNNETSVFRTSDLSDVDIWNIGRGVEQQANRNLKGRADILASSVLSIGLNVIESDPPPRHANIIGWPLDEAEIMQKAIELSEAAQGYRITQEV